MAITWKNINAPDFSAASAIMQRGNAGIQAGITGLGNLVDGEIASRKQKATDAGLLAIANAPDPSKINLSNALTQAGAGADQNAIIASLQARVATQRDAKSQTVRDNGVVASTNTSNITNLGLGSRLKTKDNTGILNNQKTKLEVGQLPKDYVFKNAKDKQTLALGTTNQAIKQGELNNQGVVQEDAHANANSVVQNRNAAQAQAQDDLIERTRHNRATEQQARTNANNAMKRARMTRATTKRGSKANKYTPQLRALYERATLNEAVPTDVVSPTGLVIIKKGAIPTRKQLKAAALAFSPSTSGKDADEFSNSAFGKIPKPKKSETFNKEITGLVSSLGDSWDSTHRTEFETAKAGWLNAGYDIKSIESALASGGITKDFWGSDTSFYKGTADTWLSKYGKMRKKKK